MAEWVNVTAVLEKYGNQLVDKYKANLRASGRVATGNLVNSVHKEINKDGWSIELDLDLAKYFEQTEWGRGPTKNGGGGELKERILDWIVAKKIVPRPDSNGRVPTPEGLAYVIARKIHNEGYDSKPDLTNAYESIEQQMLRELDAAIDKDIEDEFTLILQGL